VKLVRDKIPEIIKESGRTCDYHIADEAEHKTRLFEKMHEELHEFMADPCCDEAADMLEVVRALCHMHNIDFMDALNATNKKHAFRGGFDGGIVLDRYDAPDR
jgi:predicted house-cleaning noncanonical NTP pyrophosphatase (MazG superfamily)